MRCPVCLTPDLDAHDGVVEMHTHMVRGVELPCPMSGREPFTWNERTTREAVAGRSMGYCEWCGGIGTNMHHRVPRSQGGRWSPANILHLCGSGTTGCHGMFTHKVMMALEMGVSLKRHETPGGVPVKTPNGLLWLTDDIAPPFPEWGR